MHRFIEIVKAHPVAILGGVLIGVAIIFLATRGGGATVTPTYASNDNNNAAINAALVAAQDQARVAGNIAAMQFASQDHATDAALAAYKVAADAHLNDNATAISLQTNNNSTALAYQQASNAVTLDANQKAFALATDANEKQFALGMDQQNKTYAITMDVNNKTAAIATDVNNKTFTLSQISLANAAEAQKQSTTAQLFASATAMTKANPRIGADLTAAILQGQNGSPGAATPPSPAKQVAQAKAARSVNRILGF